MIQTRKIIMIVMSVLALGSAASWGADGGKGPPVLDLGDFELPVPEGFLVGQHASDDESFFPELEALVQVVAALIEPKLLGDMPLDKLPREDAEVIEVALYTGSMSDSLKTYLTDDFKVKLGEHEAYNLPGYPAPYGDLAFFYVVPLGEKRMLTFTALRTHVEGELEGQATGYDQVIESMLKGMRQRTK